MLQAVATFAEALAISSLADWNIAGIERRGLSLIFLAGLLALGSKGHSEGPRKAFLAALLTLPFAITFFSIFDIGASRDEGQCVGRCPVIGQIIDLEELAGPVSTRLTVRAERLGSAQIPALTIDLWLREPEPSLQTGERITGWVLVQRPHFSANFYQNRWPWARSDEFLGAAELVSIDAVSSTCHQLTACWLSQWISTVRAQKFSTSTTQTLLALVFGQAQALDSRHWQALRLTGAVHLLVVSGLHLTALMLSFNRGLLLCRVGRGHAFVLSSLFTLAYLHIIGFSTPSLRAWVMTSLILCSTASRLTFNINSVLTIALVGVLSWSPTAMTEPGFWFSFAAVALLVNFDLEQRTLIQRVLSLIRAQVALSLVSWPILWLQGAPIAVAGWLMNLILVPCVVLVVLPLSFLAVLWIVVWPQGFDLEQPSSALAVIDSVVAWFWIAIRRLGDLSPLIYSLPVSSGFAAAALSLLLFAVTRRRIVCSLWPFFFILVLSFHRAAPSRESELEIWVIDVGQGTSVFVRKDRWTLLFDAGPANEWHDAGQSIVRPFLARLGIRQLDHLVISHSDTDHSGGQTSLLKGLRAAPKRVTNASTCVLDTRPSPDLRIRALQAGSGETTNDRSCNLLVSFQTFNALLTGDPSDKVEPILASQLPHKLDWLLVSHHGARSSSSPAWLNRTRPDYAVISVGVRNAFGHPHPDVIDRLNRRGAIILTTAKHGALRFAISNEGRVRWQSVTLKAQLGSESLDF